MRRYLLAAVAAFTVIAFAAVASAQAPAPDFSVKVTKKKAGTKQKPKNAAIELSIENHETTRTMSELTITTPKTFKLSGKGLTKCDEAVLEAQGPAACPAKSRVGEGQASALVGVNGPSPSPLTFEVTAVVLGAKSIGFFLDGQELPIDVLAPGTLKGRDLTIEVPKQAQQPAVGTFAGLVSLEATLKAKKGKNYLASTTGCKNGKHRFSAELTFVANPDPANAGTESASATSACSK